MVAKTLAAGVLLSLLANAVEATDPGGRISLRVAAVHCGAGQLRSQQTGRELSAGRYARVTVEDDGEGIAPESLDQLAQFENISLMKKYQKNTILYF